MITWNNDDQMFNLMRNSLYSSVIGDILDKMKYLHQFLLWRIQPVKSHMVVAPAEPWRFWRQTPLRNNLRDRTLL